MGFENQETVTAVGNVTGVNNVAPEMYDLVVVGSGRGAKLSAWTLGMQGWRIAVVEREYIGGSCNNIACLPSKNIIHTAQVSSYAHRLKEFGLDSLDIKVNMT